VIGSSFVRLQFFFFWCVTACSAMQALAVEIRLSVCLSVCLFVCMSVKCVYCRETVTSLSQTEHVAAT